MPSPAPLDTPVPVDLRLPGAARPELQPSRPELVLALLQDLRADEQPPLPAPDPRHDQRPTLPAAQRSLGDRVLCAADAQNATANEEGASLVLRRQGPNGPDWGLAG